MQKLTVCGVALPAAMWLAGVLAGPDAAMAQARIACGAEPYVVKPGDSLSAIAQRAYSSFNYQAIFEANADRLESPAILRVGQALRIPCLGAAAGAAEPEAATAEPAEEVAAAPAAPADVVTDAEPRLPVVRQLTLRGTDPAPAAEPTREPATLLAAAPATQDVPQNQVIRLLTGSDSSRFVHRELPEGGMITDLVNRALMRADPRRRSEIAWDNDWDSHLSPLLTTGQHDLAFPWFRPDCERAQALTDALRTRCTDFDFSEPVYDIAIGYYAATGSPLTRALRHDQLAGARLCRPAGDFVVDLEAAGLVEPRITLVQPDGAAECFAMLSAGEVDVVSLDRLLGDAQVKERGLEGAVTDIPTLATRETLHVVSAKTNPYGRAYLDLIDRGLRMLRREGVWFELTSRHLADHLRRQ